MTTKTEQALAAIHFANGGEVFNATEFRWDCPHNEPHCWLAVATGSFGDGPEVRIEVPMTAIAYVQREGDEWLT